MSVHSQDSDNEELGVIGGNKPISRQVSPFSRPSSVAIMESLAKTLTAQMQSIKDQSDTTNSTLDGISRTQNEMLRSHTDLHRSQTDLSARLESLERTSPDLNPVELRTHSSDGNFLFHAVPTQVTAPLATRPSIPSDIHVDKETETSFRPLTSVSRSLLELNPPPVLRRSERIRSRIMMGGIQEEV